MSAVAQNNSPDPPKFQSASVIPESSPTTVRLTWLPSDSTNVAGYIIYKIVDNITTTIDSVIGKESTLYEYTASSANSTSERFRLASFDVDGYKSTITDPHKTILLSSSYESCGQKVTLSWTNYSGWGTEIANYRIYRRHADSEYILIETTPATSTSYVDENLENGQWYYYVEAVKNDGITATSNSINFTATSTYGPLLIKANYATVAEDQNIALNFQIVNSGQVSEYRILRSINNETDFSVVARFQYSGQTQITYIDRNVDVSRNIYSYKLVSIDPCGGISKASNIASNILLRVTSQIPTEHNLEWNEYRDWPNGVMFYKIYSYIYGVSTEIGTVESNQYTFSHNIDNAYNANYVRYYIEAYENTYDTQQQNVSKSNIAYISENSVEGFGKGAIALYPNPTDGQLTVENCEGANYEICDIMGKVLVAGTITNKIETINIASKVTGNLVLKITSDNKIVIRPFVKF